VADVLPFRAVRYAHPSAAVVAPPYDVISPAERQELLRRDPHNVVRLTLEDDAERAGELYRHWLATDVLVHEDLPAVWVWEQEFTGRDGSLRRRLGIAASLQAVPYERREVAPHERTHPEPIQSRLRLLRAARAQLEPLFFLYEGDPPLARPARSPDLEAEATRLWRVEDDGVVEAFFDSRQVLIADGHHRYETSLAYAAETGAPSDARVLAVLVSTGDPGLEILATHRIYSGRPDIAPAGDPCSDIEDALARLAREPYGRAAAIFYRDGKPLLVSGNEGELDVDLVGREGLDGIAYTIDWADAVSRVDRGEAECAFLVRPTRIEDVFERARRGEVMPPKATHFFPKLTSGLLFHPLEDA
jgi:uncharacterized protein (DUF1015 family)